MIYAGPILICTSPNHFPAIFKIIVRSINPTTLINYLCEKSPQLCLPVVTLDEAVVTLDMSVEGVAAPESLDSSAAELHLELVKLPRLPTLLTLQLLL